MKNKRSKLLVCVIVVLIAGLIASIVAIVNLTEQVESLQETVNNQFNTMNANINSIYSNVDNALKKQTSIVSSVEESKGNLNESDLTVPVSLKIVPKDIAEDTKLSVEIGDKIYPLSKSGSTEYSATVSVPLFNSENAVLLIESKGETKTELLEDVYVSDMWYSYLPMIDHADFSGSYGYSNGKYNFNGRINIISDATAKMDNRSFEKVSLEAAVNGKKVWEQDVTETFNKAEGEIPLNKGFEMKQTDKLTIDVVAVDGAGIIHRYTAHISNESSSFVDGAIETIMNDGDCLYYPDGTKVFS